MDNRKLLDVLSLQKELLERLLSLMELETSELSSINITAMEELNQQKAEIASRLETQTVSLKKTISAYAAEKEISPEASLGDVVDALADNQISQLHQELKVLAQRVRGIAEMNGEIAERFIESVGTSLELLTRVVNQSNIYGASGGYQQRSSGSVMINREA